MTFNQTARDLFQRLRNKQQLGNYFTNKANLEQPSAEFMNKIGASLPEQMSFKTPLDNAIGSNGAMVSQGSNLAQGLSKAAPIVGAGLNAVNAVDKFKSGDAIGGALNIGKMAGVVPGVGTAIAAVSTIADMVKNAFDSKNQEAMQKSQEENAKAQQFSENTLANQRQGIEETNQQNLQKMQGQMQNTQPQNNSALVQDILGQVTGGASDVQQGYSGQLPNLTQEPNYAEESNPTMTPDEMALIEQNQQNPQPVQQEDVKQSLMDKFKSGLSDFAAGYQNNANTDFAHGDLMKNVTTGGAAPVQQGNQFNLGAEANKKSVMARLGELAGTGQRVMAHPLTQAAIAGGISKAAGGDIDDIAKAAFQYGSQKAAADRYYQQVTGNTNRPFLNSYSAQDVTNKRLEDAMAQRQQQWMYEQMIKQAQQDYNNQFNREKFEYQKNKDAETNALRKEEIAARKEYYRNRGGGRPQAFDPTTVPGFYDDYDKLEQMKNIKEGSDEYNNELNDVLDAMYQGQKDGWWGKYSDEQINAAKQKMKEAQRQYERDFNKKYRINPLKGKKS